jgi:hypothetical protein
MDQFIRDLAALRTLLWFLARLWALLAWLWRRYPCLVKHKGTKRSHRSAAGIEAAREDARASRVARGLPADPEDKQPPTANRTYVQLPSGEWWPEGEPVPPEVAALEPQVNVWTTGQRKKGR